MRERTLLKRILLEVLDYSKIIFLAVLAAMFLKENVVASALVPSGSMEETVMTGDRIMINRLAYIAEEPQRGDIVAFYYPDDGETLYLKRVMGLPGEIIEGIDGYVYINGVKMENDFTTERIEYDFAPFEVPKDCYFMLGDNRNNSWDSRYWQNSFVEKDEIIGKAAFTFYPEIRVLE